MNKLQVKRIPVFVFCLLLSAGLFSQEKNSAKLKFEKDIEPLGTLFIHELETQKLEIEFENEGDEPLILSYVRGCCGTRIKSWTKEPVMPGEKGKIEIEFRLAPRPHRISRTVSVMSNDPEGMKVFRITGEVAEQAAEEPFGFEINKGAAPRVR
ncbi:MAG: DUF1573 domain-containing protein [Bacteroidetes bacterium]|nr:MAG: DUF1573 domain-containing protein [Bacteroidota bacterium]